MGQLIVGAVRKGQTGTMGTLVEAKSGTNDTDGALNYTSAFLKVTARCVDGNFLPLKFML